VPDWIVTTRSPEETRRLGNFLGQAVERPVLFLLSGDLGAGKTCLAQGLAGGLDVPEDEPVTSPTYTLMNQYKGRFDLFHFDLYRLSQPEDLLDLGFDEYVGGPGVVLVEWADRFPEVLQEGLLIRMDWESVDRRRIRFKALDESHETLLERLKNLWEKGEGS